METKTITDLSFFLLVNEWKLVRQFNAEQAKRIDRGSECSQIKLPCQLEIMTKYTMA